MNPRPRPPAFSRLQTAVLIITAVLGMFWILLGVTFVLTDGFSSAWLETPAAPPAAVIATVEVAPTLPPATDQPAGSAAAVPATVPPTECAQRNSGVWLAPSALVLDDGAVEVQMEGETIQVRLASVRLPEDPALLDQAVDKARQLFDGQDVMLVKDKSEQDGAGRPVRYVFAGGQFVNYELVRQGLANAVLDGPDLACVLLLRQAEQQARGDRLGMWNPVPAPTATFVPFVTLDPAQAACDCSIRYNCSDFTRRAQAQACYNACNDYHSRLDLDRDGIACEGLP